MTAASGCQVLGKTSSNSSSDPRNVHTALLAAAVMSCNGGNGGDGSVAHVPSWASFRCRRCRRRRRRRCLLPDHRLICASARPRSGLQPPNTASAVAPPLFRGSPLDPAYRAPSTPLHESRIDDYASLRREYPRTTTPLPPSILGKDISRPSSTTLPGTGSLFLGQAPLETRRASFSLGREWHSEPRPALPGLATLTALATNIPPIRSFSGSHGSPLAYHGLMPPVPTPGIAGNAPPVCQNCQTSTTPLWRRDEAGSVLCNACGLFLKLHGRPRPISLKTDVIKSRNRVKTATPGAKKKLDHNGFLPGQAEMPTPSNGFNAHRRVSQMAASVASDRSHSPISRTATPGGHQDPNIAPQHLFDGAVATTLHEPHANGSPTLPPLQLGQPSSQAGPVSTDRHLDPPMTYDQLLAANTHLRTRVSELEVINMVYSDNETSLRKERDRAIHERDELKRKVEELEKKLLDIDHDEKPTKKPRLSAEPA